MPYLASLLPLFLTLAAAVQGWLGVFLDATDHPQVLQVIPDSPAAKAGIQIGDRFVSVDDVATPTREEFIQAIGEAKKGQRVRLKLLRDGKEQTVVVRLGERPPEDEIPEPPATQPAPAAPKAPGAPAAKQPPAPSAPQAEPAPAAPAQGQDGTPFLGVGLSEGDDGLEVTQVVDGSPAAVAGLEVDDVVVQFDKATIKTQADLEAALARCKPGQKVELQLRHEGGRKSVVVTLGSKPAPANQQGRRGGLVARPERALAPATRAPVVATEAPSAQERGWLGVNLSGDEDGVEIVGVTEGGPAAKAGLAAGDRIVALDGEEIEDLGALQARLGKTKPGQVVEVGVRRGDEVLARKVTLGPRPATAAAPAVPPISKPVEAPTAVPTPAPAPTPLAVPKLERGWLGVGLQDEEESVEIGTIVADGPAAKAGLRVGDRLVSLDGHAVGSTEEVQAWMAKTKVGQHVVVAAMRGDEAVEARVTLGARQTAAPTPAGETPRAAEATTQPKPEAVAAPKGFGTDFAAAQRRAKRADKPLLVVFAAPWDGSSHAQARAFADPAVAELLQGFQCVWLDTEKNAELVEQKKVRELPMLAVISGDQAREHVGYLPAEELRKFLAGGGDRPARDGARATRVRPAPAATPDRPATAANPKPPVDGLRAEIEALRKELADLRKQLEELRRQGGGRE